MSCEYVVFYSCVKNYKTSRSLKELKMLGITAPLEETVAVCRYPCPLALVPADRLDVALCLPKINSVQGFIKLQNITPYHKL